MKNKNIIYSFLLFGILIGAGGTKFVYERGLFSVLDAEEYINGLSHGKEGRNFQFEERALLQSKKTWPQTVNTIKFQKLSIQEQDKVRDEYFKKVISVGLPPLGASNAESEFISYANNVEDEVKKYGFFEEPLNLPKTGIVKRYSQAGYVAPLSVKTASGGHHHYIKVSGYESNVPILTAFIRSGDTLEVKLPVGDYAVKYATGYSWYGEKHLFGPQTQRSEAKRKFSFKRDENGYSGYTIELFQQANGNLKTDSIGKHEW